MQFNRAGGVVGHSSSSSGVTGTLHHTMTSKMSILSKLYCVTSLRVSRGFFLPGAQKNSNLIRKIDSHHATRYRECRQCDAVDLIDCETGGTRARGQSNTCSDTTAFRFGKRTNQIQEKIMPKIK
jgi:hypothetical protein